MKFELTADEFETFCEQLAKGHTLAQVQALEVELGETRADRDGARDEHNYWLNRSESLRSENDRLQRENDTISVELRHARQMIQELNDKLTPYKRERQWSLCFAEYFAGKKIQAIKEIRLLTNQGLKEAKDIVEGVYKNWDRPELVALSELFGKLGSVDGGTLHSYLVPFGLNASPEELTSILAGKFHQKFDAKTA